MTHQNVEGEGTEKALTTMFWRNFRSVSWVSSGPEKRTISLIASQIFDEKMYKCKVDI